jgi:hypothetical protein
MSEMVEKPRKTRADFDRQRASGWPDFHPEDYCHRCGNPNPSWWVAGPVWNLVIRTDREPGDRWNEIICPSCFAELAGDITFELRVDPNTTRGALLLQAAGQPMNDDRITTGHCPVCERDDVRLRPYLDVHGRDRIACDDEHACLAAHARRQAMKPKPKKATR